MRLFKSKKQVMGMGFLPEPTSVKDPITKRKTEKELIEEIHESFFTEVDRLLAEAKIAHPVTTEKQDVLDKGKVLADLGFAASKTTLEADKEADRLRELERDNALKAEMIRAISYFSTKYPQYKFITEDSVKKICEKYNLVYGNVGFYEGDVPDKNLKQISEFKIKEEDACYIETRRYGGWPSEMVKTLIGFDEFKIKTEKERGFDIFYSYSYDKAPLEIAAPAKDFSKGLEVKDFKIDKKVEIPDPVVLQPVMFGKTKHYLIVTAWGNEASDELVVNEINN